MPTARGNLLTQRVHRQAQLSQLHLDLVEAEENQIDTLVTRGNLGESECRGRLESPWRLP